MQDLYTFDMGRPQSLDTYSQIRDLYKTLLHDICLPFTIFPQLRTGSIGGSASEEFHVVAPHGNETDLSVPGCERRSYEIAHIYQLGEIYTRPLGATFVNSDGVQCPTVMCSFGLGIERTICAFLEHRFANPPFHWSWNLAPAHIFLIGKGGEADQFYDRLERSGQEVIYDDRDIPEIEKLTEGLQWGLPIYLTVGSHGAGTVHLIVPELDIKVNCDFTSIEHSIMSISDRLMEKQALIMEDSSNT